MKICWCNMRRLDAGCGLFDLLGLSSDAAVNQIRHALGEYMACHILGGYTKTSPKEVLLQRDAQGKPFFPGSRWFVSISHSGDYVTCAVGREPVGIDIERIRPIKERVMYRVCTQREMDYISPGTEDADRRFLECWTAKEALFKCCGGSLPAYSMFSLPENVALRRIDKPGYVLTVVCCVPTDCQ